MIVLFDFDSTLIDCESLDEMLSELLQDRPDDAARVREFTDAGMEGRIPFGVALAERLAIAKPTLAQVTEFGTRAIGHLTPGIDEVVRGLGDSAWIVSGGLEDALLPVAGHLGIPRERVLGTEVAWAPDGTLASAIGVEKPARVALAASDWPHPRVAIGDGMSDYALFERGVVDHFIAFTQHVRRDPVVATGAREARTVRELEYALRRLT
ncbi:MAG: HAD-IB family phosphatase [Planctomycetota bacterium]